MAQTKQPHPRHRGARGPATKVPRKVIRKKAPTGNMRPHRFRPGTRALIEIRQMQRSMNLLIRRAPFSRLVNEIAHDPQAWFALQTGGD